MIQSHPPNRAIVVLDGVRPEGYSWRRIPLPAYNCDGGNNCAIISDSHSYVSYATIDTTNAYGNCPTGLHRRRVVDGGVRSTLVVGTSGGMGGNNGKGDNNSNSPCATHWDSTVCLADTGNNCKWYTGKNICYETRGGGSGNKCDSGAKDDTEICSVHTGEASCLAGTENGSQCIWYESAAKSVCYSNDGGGSSSNTERGGKEGYKNSNHKKSSIKEDGNTGGSSWGWYIIDRVYAPTEPGDYILQWRWDNDQTPQIWINLCRH
jgi:hypothetical protein